MIPQTLHQLQRERDESMSNTKTRWNICFAILAFFLSIAAFTGCGKNEKTGNECGKTEVFADDLQKGNAAYDEGEYDAATEFFRIAAQEGNSEALFCLGRAYYFGMGVEQNFQEAVKWFRLAADQGNPQERGADLEGNRHAARSGARQGMGACALSVR